MTENTAPHGGLGVFVRRRQILCHYLSQRRIVYLVGCGIADTAEGGDMKERVLQTARYIVDNRATVRQAAAAMGVSKSTVHSDMNEKLKYIDMSLYEQVREVLAYNLRVRHLRGGMATRRKYKK